MQFSSTSFVKFSLNNQPHGKFHVLNLNLANWSFIFSLQNFCSHIKRDFFVSITYCYLNTHRATSSSRELIICTNWQQPAGKMIAPVLAHSLAESKTQLSGESTIMYPDDAGFNSMRWSDFPKPNPGAIINVGNEDDICSTVRFSFPSKNSQSN